MFYQTPLEMAVLAEGECLQEVQGDVERGMKAYSEFSVLSNSVGYCAFKEGKTAS